MSHVIQCDRCKKIYSRGDKKFKINDVKLGGLLLTSVSFREIEKYDLCDDCARDLFHWLCNDQEYDVEAELEESRPSVEEMHEENLKQLRTLAELYGYELVKKEL